MAVVKIGAENLDINTKRILAALVDELTALRAAHSALTAKLDADDGVTDTDYAATCAPAAAAVTK